MGYKANHLRAQLASRAFLHDPADATVATKIGYVPMGSHFKACVMLIAGTGLLTVKVFAATDAAGTGATEVPDGAHADPTVADAAGDQVWVEVDQAQVQKALPGATHVSVEVDMDVNTDTAAVFYVVEPKVAKDGNTADIIA